MLQAQNLDDPSNPGAVSTARINESVWQRVYYQLSTDFQFTVAELEVLKLALCGHSVSGISRTRNTTETTTRNQFRSMLQKTGTSGQPQLLAFVFRLVTE